LLADGAAPFEFAVVCEVFGLERPEIIDPWPYELVLCSASGSSVTSSLGFVIDGLRPLSAVETADTIVVPASGGDVVRPPTPEVIAALQRAYRRGARLLSVCSGAFVLGHAGLLDGRRATTHWMYTSRLAQAFPAAKVDPNVLYVDDGQILTSAGTAAGIDLCLHVVRTDHGAEVANSVARRMVVPPHRDGGQAQFVRDAIVTECESDQLAATLDWAVEHLGEPLTVELLARRALMSPRTFARRFRDATGTTPLQWLLRQRILHSQRLLEATDLPVEVIAERCGFGSATVLRTHFRRLVDTSPLGYRRTFHARAS